LKLIVAANVPKYLWTDAVRLKQILINLLGNAIKFTEKGSIELEIVLLQETENDSKNLRFIVKDTGKGILIENQAKIFKAFSQEDNSTTRKFGGTGLGLSISNQLLGLMNSKLELQSTIGKGSVFYFDVTLKTATESEHQLTENNYDLDKINEINVLAFEKITDSVKVLIVEDNKINMLLIKTILKNMLPNATLIEANNGKKALEEFENHMPDLIFMDIQMPLMNGYEATEAIRTMVNGRNVPIIALTAGTVKEERDRCIEAGMNDYITKPIIKGTIEEVLQKWITKNGNFLTKNEVL